MKLVAVMLDVRGPYEPDADLLKAGLIGVFLALGLLALRSRKTPLKRYNVFWLFLFSSVCLVALSFICGSYVAPRPE
jgi:hypothetical protein